MKNSLMVLECYRHNGTWAFDDDRVGLAAEPFLEGIPEIIDQAIVDSGEELKHAYDGSIYLTFGVAPFPSAAVELTWLREGASNNVSDPSNDYGGGNWYRCENTKAEGWLCPALFKYFDYAPRKLYAKVEVVDG